MADSVVVIFHNVQEKKRYDIEIPVDITVRELLVGLNEAFCLNIDLDDVKNCYLKIENPFKLLKGHMILRESGIRNGSTINFG